MAWAFVQAAKNFAGGVGGDILVVPGTVAGNAIIVVVNCDHGHPATAPTGVNTYVQVGTTGVDSANGQEASIWIAKNIAGGTESITFQPSASIAAWTVVALEVSGLDTTAPFDVAATPVAGGAMGSTPASNALTPGAANELLILAVNDTSANNATFAQGTGQTLNANANEAGGSGTGATAVSYGNTASGSNTAFMNNTQTADDAVILLAAFKLAGGATVVPIAWIGAAG